MNGRLRRFLASPVAAVAAVAMLSALCPPARAADLAGHWQGVIGEGPTPLGLTVNFTRTSQRWSGVLTLSDSPERLTLQRIGIDDADRLTFTLSDGPSALVFTGKLTPDGTVRGTFLSAGRPCPFRLTRGAAPAPNVGRRPQTPRPPLPYAEEEVRYRSGDLTLAGTLTLPPKSSRLTPSPAVLLLSGSGPHDRDAASAGHEMFRVLADHLTRRAGLAVLRVDDRGVGKSAGKPDDATIEELAADALAGVAYLCTRPDIDPVRVGLLGHSEGAAVAPLAASQSDGAIAFLVLLAPPGVPGDELFLAQRRALAEAAGHPRDRIDADLLLDAYTIAFVKQGLDFTAVRSKVLRRQSPTLADVEHRRGRPMATPGLDGYLRTFFHRPTRHLLSYDPRPALRRTTSPVLILHGDLDPLTPAEPNLPEVEKALRNGGNKHMTARRLAGVTHQFQRGETGRPDEYGRIEETIDAAALDLITDWIATSDQ